MLLTHFASTLVDNAWFARVGWLLGGTLIATAVWRTQRTVALVERAVTESVKELQLLPMRAESMASSAVVRTTSRGAVDVSEPVHRVPPIANVRHGQPVWQFMRTTPRTDSSTVDKLPKRGAMLAAPSARRRPDDRSSRSSARTRR
jgi:hypothetical protein